MLFELAWEVCNKVGGIYQVLRSKVPSMVERWRDRYCLIGPYVPEHASLEFEARRPAGRLADVVAKLEQEGIRAHFGRWLVTGSPRVLLLEPMPADRLGELKYHLWQRTGVDFGPGGPLVDGVLGFGLAASRALCLAAEAESGGERGSGRRVIAQAHEWMGGVALSLARDAQVPVATVFTTHATMLGRYVASSGEPLYDRLPWIDPAGEAARFDIRIPHALERLCAQTAHVFTTVSPITGEECKALLGRAPDVVTPNGLNMDRYDVGHEFQTMHAECKRGIHRFVMGHFFPSYEFDLDRTIYLFTSGRYEPRNKGFDLCLEAMARLNAQLKSVDLGVTVVFFVVTDRPTHAINPGVLQSRGVLNEMQEVCGRVLDEVGATLLERAAAGRPLRLDEAVSQYWSLRYRRTQQAFRSSSLPPVVTHMMTDEEDPVLAQIRHLGLFNRREDPVKVVYHPRFISPVSPLWGIEYDQFVRGCHAGVFPSAYEPWGYTPLECVASGVPAITSDLAGFGRYVAERFPTHDDWGLHVLKRRGRGFHDAAADLARWLHAFCRLDRPGRIHLRNRVEERAGDFDWSRLVQAYHEAHETARRRSPAAPGEGAGGG